MRVRSLDILRGLAILMVLCNHVDFTVIDGVPGFSGKAGFIYWRIKQFGWSGVDLFFVLSGFLIGGLLLGEIERTGTVRVGRFWLRRGFKIWPSYLVLLAALAITGVTDFVDSSSLIAFVQTLGAHLFFLQNYLRENPNSPTWSLAVEEHFYLVLPLLLLALAYLAKRREQSAIQFLPVAVLGIAVFCFLSRLVNVSLGWADPNDFVTV